MPFANHSVAHIYDVAMSASQDLHMEQYSERLSRLIIQYLQRVDKQTAARKAREGGAASAVDSAFVVGLHGAWGCGKSTLMKMIQAELKSRADDLMIVEFQAWKFNQREVLWRALLSRIVSAAREKIEKFDKVPKAKLEKELEAIEEALFRDYEQSVGHSYGLNLGAIPALLQSAVKLDALGAVKNLLKTVERNEVKKFHCQIAALDQFEAKFRELRAALGVPWLILVDDLDRCLPESSIDIFEATKVFLDVPGVVFVLALDKQTIRSGLQVRYQEKAGERPLIDPEQYIEKMTNVSFVLPTLHQDEVESFVEHLCDPAVCDRADGIDKELVKRMLNLVLQSDGPGIQPNPRRWIRLLNTAFLYQSILERVVGEDAPEAGGLGGPRESQFIKLLLLSYRWGGFMDAVLSSWDVMETFERAARQAERDFESYKSVCEAKYPELRPFAEDPDLFRLLHSSPQVASLGADDPVRRLFI
jgi:hypothetical protein